ncbi:ABC transporter ATP-binding protein [Tessaracoccus antarcticus]|uniref:ABC transporter ATP-binding protein n=1 Tax=Tessaracoccus antarcticus TaxID=2479848 RepID=A0A3M0GNY5_9ACTN|nr:ABC transporter ATP-binding protein [Tessaracoccus antarcticus]RMB58996.1 ABC transporter ATP-binding protein [Tessaracoccus antarcticus]
MSEKTPVLSVRSLSVDYLGDRTVHAVRDVSLVVGRGEIVGLAGESGCGKSTFAYGVNQLLRPPALITGGEVVFHDRSGQDINVLELEKKDLRAYRWDKVSMVFQGAMNSLNPVTSIRSQMADVFTTHRPDMSRKDRLARSRELLELVGVDPGRLGSYAHELSGGMRQRVMIAMALALNPQLMIMDEPTTALDVVVQREILTEIMRLREELGFAVIFITHDLPMLLEISDRIAIMRAGQILELGTAEDIYFDAQNDYTRKLLTSFPSLTGERGDFIRGSASDRETAVI